MMLFTHLNIDADQIKIASLSMTPPKAGCNMDKMVRDLEKKLVKFVSKANLFRHHVIDLGKGEFIQVELLDTNRTIELCSFDQINFVPQFSASFRRLRINLMLTRGNQVRRTTQWAKVNVMRQSYRVKRTLRRGKIIDKSNTQKWNGLTTPDRIPLRKGNLGKVRLIHDIEALHPVFLTDVEQLPMILKGDNVLLSYHHDGILLQAEATAVSDSTADNQVQVIVLGATKPVTARIIRRGYVEYVQPNS